MIYIDEAGVSRQQDDDFTVVAGVVISPDRHIRAVEDRLASIAQEYLPTCQEISPFHAKDLWHGSGLFPRQTWPRERRMELFGKLAMIPSEYDLPIVWGAISKLQLQSEFEPDNPLILTASMAAAFVYCAGISEKWLMVNTAWDEVAIMICEDSPRWRKLIKSLHFIMSDPGLVAQAGKQIDVFPLERIRDTVHFATKAESQILQVADLCAFLIKRRLNQKRDSDFLFEHLTGKIVTDLVEVIS